MCNLKIVTPVGAAFCIVALLWLYNSMIVVRDGSAVAVWHSNGQVEIIEGPRTAFRWNCNIQHLQLHTASPNQYICVALANGTRLHIPGPASLRQHPVIHQSVHVADAVPVNNNEVLIVYRHEDNAVVTRRIVRGPQLYIPSSSEWIHTFSWHGSEQSFQNVGVNPTPTRNAQNQQAINNNYGWSSYAPNSESGDSSYMQKWHGSDQSKGAHTGIKIPGALKFQKLRTIPDRMHVQVQHVRTMDDALVSVKMMIFYELVDIERMLDNSHDPIGDFISAVSADVVAFTSNITFPQFKESSKYLNDIEVYPQLVAVGKRTGYDIKRIIFRGYTSSDALQRMTDKAIETRTQLALEAETELQKEDMEDLTLKRESERADAQQELEEKQLRHRIALRVLREEEELRLAKQRLEQDIAAQALQREEREKASEVEIRQRLSFLDSLRTLGVNLDLYFTSQRHVDHVTRIETDGAMDGFKANLAALHAFHSNSSAHNSTHSELD